MKGWLNRLEESKDPLLENAREGLVMERKTDGLDVKEVLLEGSRKAKEREAQKKELLREVERRTWTHRVDPRWQLEEQMDQLLEQNDARRPRKGRRKVGTWKGLLYHPKKGDLNLEDAWKRRLVDL